MYEKCQRKIKKYQRQKNLYSILNPFNYKSMTVHPFVTFNNVVIASSGMQTLFQN